MRVVLASLTCLAAAPATTSCASRGDRRSDDASSVDASPAHAIQPSTQNSLDLATGLDQTAAASRRIRDLIAAGSLVLSTDAVGGADEFHFQMWLAKQVSEQTTSSMDVFVSREGDRVGVLVSSASGSPYSYLSNGLLVVVDHQQKGGLAVYAAGAPRLVLGLDPDTSKLNFELQFDADAKKPKVTVDLACLLEHTVETMQLGSVDEANHCIRVQTAHSATTIGLPAQTQTRGLPVRSFLMRNAAQGVTVAIVNLSDRQPPDMDLVNVDQRSVAALGVPLRVMKRGEAMMAGLVVPPSFGFDAAEREASQRLASLLGGKRQEHRSGNEADSRIRTLERSEQWPIIK
jgi:hypothetical protein